MDPKPPVDALPKVNPGLMPPPPPCEEEEEERGWVGWPAAELALKVNPEPPVGVAAGVAGDCDWT